MWKATGMEFRMHSNDTNTLYRLLERHGGGKMEPTPYYAILGIRHISRRHPHLDYHPSLET